MKPDFSQSNLSSLSSKPALLNNLPTFTTDFVGRALELQAVKRGLTESSLLAIIAPGGMGKTRLALQAASELLDVCPAGVFFISLASVANSALVLPAIMQALNLQFTGRRDLKDVLLSHLSGLRQDMLLVVDNFEHLLEGSSLLVELLKCSPHLKLLVASRERLTLPGAVQLELHGLPYPAAGVATENFEQYGAVQLFLQMTRRPETNLALELAAAWSSLFSLDEIARQLEHNLDLLTTTRADIPARQRSARAVFDYFWGLLSEAEQHWAGCLSVFRGGFDSRAAQQVAGVSPFFLAALADRSFLTRALDGR